MREVSLHKQEEASAADKRALSSVSPGGLPMTRPPASQGLTGLGVCGASSQRAAMAVQELRGRPGFSCRTAKKSVRRPEGRVRTTTLEATQGQIPGQSPTDATSGR